MFNQSLNHTEEYHFISDNRLKVSKGAKIRNRYNQVPHLTQSDKLTVDTTNESQEVSPFPASDHKAHINRRAQNIKHKTEQKQKNKKKAELQRLKNLDIIEHVDGPTDWVLPIVVAPKPKSKSKEIRICVDMSLPNLAIKQTRHLIPTIDDMIVDLNDARVFSKLNLRQGYHQLLSFPQLRHVTTFTTHVGLRRYKRLSFGINNAAEIFQNAIQNALEGLEGVRNISDDIIVFGCYQEHDQRLGATFKRLQEKHLTVNNDKCELNKPSLEFFRYVFGEKGLSASPSKCEVIKKTSAPTNVS